jgi:PIN domain nuclease of toxin-antitoxin system
MGISYLIDTHVLLWWVFDDPKLCEISRQILKDPAHKIYVSSASAWEISTKYRIGKMPEAKQLLSNYEILLDKLGFNQLSVTTTHALRAGQLQIEHRDPFDRMLMAQAELESIPIITYDKAFHRDFIDVIPGGG